MVDGLINNNEKWQQSLIYGTQLQIESGVVGTAESPNGHPRSSFSGDSTVILGASDKYSEKPISITIASWNIPNKSI